MQEKYLILKNLAALAFGHFLVFTAFDSLSNLQSTVNHKEGVGIASQSIIYACFTISSFFLPTYLIKRFGCKKTLLISVFSVCPYVIANLYPEWSTLVPSAVLSGMAFGPLWAARSTYVNKLSFKYSSYTKTSISVVNAWFFGIYSFFHENAEIWGNVLSYYVLKSNNNGTGISVADETFLQCGADFCDAIAETANPNLQRPDDRKWNTLVGIYVCFVIVAGIVIILFVDSLESEGMVDDGGKEESKLSANLFTGTLKHMKNQGSDGMVDDKEGKEESKLSANLFTGTLKHMKNRDQGSYGMVEDEGGKDESKLSANLFMPTLKHMKNRDQGSDGMVDDEGSKEESKVSANLFMATLKHMKNRDQLLLIPLSFYCGLADGFYNSDFTKSYIACAWGISRVGHVTICYGVISAIMDCSSGLLVKWLTRMPVFVLATSSHLYMLATLLLWGPNQHNYPLYVALSGIYGVGASVWWSQIIAFYGIIFKANEEPAFSNFYFWSSFGFSVAYAYSDTLCTYVKIYILIALLIAAITGYIAVEVKHLNQSKSVMCCKTPHTNVKQDQAC